MNERPYSLFEVVGIEIESMLVDAASHDVAPCADRVLRAAEALRREVPEASLPFTGDVDDAPIAWSNELVAHVVEFKTAAPVRSFDGLAEAFRSAQRRCDRLARASCGARLVPGAMHPWMDPRRDTVLWPHEGAEIYGAYDRLFDCERHGWANLQSVHLNLPFANDDEFGRLHAATRLVLPLIPALAAASPFVDGVETGRLDERLFVYRTNSAKVGAMTGDVIPERIFGRERYERVIFGTIDDELRALGADEALIGAPFTNARGAIARFDRMALEIRLIDAQECAAADLAIAAAVTALVRGLAEEHWSSTAAQREVRSAGLVALLDDATARGGAATLPTDFAALFGSRAGTAGALVRALLPSVFRGPAELEDALGVVLEHGALAERMRAAVARDADGRPTRAGLAELLERANECALSGVPFLP